MMMRTVELAEYREKATGSRNPLQLLMFTIPSHTLYAQLLGKLHF